MSCILAEIHAMFFVNYGFFACLQMRKLVDACINPDPEQRPDVSYVYDVAKRMYTPPGEAK